MRGSLIRALLTIIMLYALGSRASAEPVFPAMGPATFYPTRATFDAVRTGLTSQSFDGANLFGQPFVTTPSPLDAATNDGVFPANSVVPGLVIRTRRPGSIATALIVYGGGPASAISVGNNWFGDTLLLDFPAGISAVGFNVFGNTSYGTSFKGAFSIRFFSGSRLIASRTYREVTGGYDFVGVSSRVPITRVAIDWASDGDATTYVSAIEFG